MDRPDIRKDASVRGFLEHFEDEIVMNVISRAQFAANPKTYERNYYGDNRYMGLLDELLLGLEKNYSIHGRYKDPIERPFNSGLPAPKDKKVAEYPDVQLDDYDSVNVTQFIMEEYLRFVPDF